MVGDLMALPQWLLAGRSEIEEVSRRNSRATYVGDGTLLSRVLGKYLMYLAVSDRMITPYLAMEGFWEAWITAAMAATLRPDWWCVDVGANHGYYTVLMADSVGPGGHVAAVEPSEVMAPLLRWTLFVNGFARWTEVHQEAAWDRHGSTARLVVPPMLGSGASLLRSPEQGDAVIEVQTLSIDRLTEAWPRLDLVKIDAEGAELAIWHGMRESVARHRAITVFMEFNAARYADGQAFLQEITDAGFPLRYIGYDGSVQPVAAAEILDPSRTEDWMLFLRHD
jgi:FkbM family methyltransferase